MARKTEKQYRKKHRISNILIGIVAFLFFGFWGLHSATFLVQNPNKEVYESLALGFAHMVTNPKEIVFAASSALWWKAFIPVSIVLAVIFILLWVDDIRHRHYSPDAACGTAQWNSNVKKYNKDFTDPFEKKTSSVSDDLTESENMILTKNVFLSLDGYKTGINDNILVLGGSGSGKSRFFVKPNILQANSNYVITDPSGELLMSTGKFLQHKGYEVKVFNLVEFEKSNCYNPFKYIRDDAGVFSMIDCFLKNTKIPGKTGGDQFWEDSEKALLSALCLYFYHHDNKHASFSNVLKMLLLANVDEFRKETSEDKLDSKFNVLDDTDIAKQQYQIFKQAGTKTAKSILISCAVRLNKFTLPEISNLTDTDDISLGDLGTDKKQALFVIIPTADTTYNFLVAMMYSQLFETLYHKSETEKGSDKRLDRNVRFLLDEFANIANLPDFEKKLATMRKYNISCSIILQSLAQLKAMYEKEWPGIVTNCDTLLFLGSGNDEETAKYISELLGESTIVVKDRSMSNGRSSSSSQSYKTTSRKLMTTDEVLGLKRDECLLKIRGIDPFHEKKYDYTKHPNFKYTADNKKNGEEWVFVNKLNNKHENTNETLSVIKEEENKSFEVESQSIIDLAQEYGTVSDALHAFAPVIDQFRTNTYRSIKWLDEGQPFPNLPDDSNIEYENLDTSGW